jgi:hypothetical protein
MSSLPETITIESCDLPSGKVNVTLKCPRYGDLRKARKLYPNETDNRGRRKSPGYATEELLICQQLVDVTDNDGISLLDKHKAKDIIDRLTIFSIPDRQALMTIFLEIFWVGAEQAKAARDLAKEFMVTAAFNFHISKEQMPMGEFNLSYNAPNTGTQMAADRRYQGVQEQGCTLEEFLFAMCLHSTNDDVVEPSKDVISVLDSWTIADVQFANLVFINQFTLDDSEEEKAKEAGKRYLEKLGIKKAEPSGALKRPTKSTQEATKPL